MNIFNYLFRPTEKEPWDWVFVKPIKEGLLIINRKSRKLFKKFQGDYDIVKMRKEHIDILEDNLIHIIKWK